MATGGALKLKPFVIDLGPIYIVKLNFKHMNNKRLDNHISDKQLKANQENAKKGGVKTIEGKELIKYNAVKHGLLCKEAVISGESQEEFDNFSQEMMEDLMPNNKMEECLAERIITNMWRLKRVMNIEKKINLSVKTDYEDFSILNENTEASISIKTADNDVLGKIMRYETAIERSFYRAIHEYKLVKNGFVWKNV